MRTIQINTFFPLCNGKKINYNGIAYDGTFTYLSSVECCEVHKYDNFFRRTEIIKTDQGYSSICYDSLRRCFWAVIPLETGIFQLDHKFMILNHILVTCKEDSPVLFSGIHSLKNSGAFLLTGENKIYKAEEIEAGVMELVLKQASGSSVISAALLESDILACYESVSGCGIFVNEKNSRHNLHCCLPKGYNIKSMAIVSSEIFYLLAEKQDSDFYVIEGKISTMETAKAPLERDQSNDQIISPEEIISKAILSKALLSEGIFPEDIFKKEIFSEEIFPNNMFSEEIFPKEIYLEEILPNGNCHNCNCYKECCQKGNCHNHNCHKECCHKGCCNHPGKSCDENLYDVIHSIALMETALSHILNAEGEKIQKVIAHSSSTADLLLVNESVCRTIVNITQLEQTLFAKLQVIKNAMKSEPVCCVK